ncbi:MAG: hypothetical protein NVS3B8_04230 [Chitinophagaceae bacterium]
MDQVKEIFENRNQQIAISFHLHLSKIGVIGTSPVFKPYFYRCYYITFYNVPITITAATLLRSQAANEKRLDVTGTSTDNTL